jgi:hypothetical protein
MKLKKLSYEKGLLMLKTKRPDVIPNVGFTQQLLEYEETTIEKSKKKNKK